MNPLPTKHNRWRPVTVFNLLVGLLFSLSALAQPVFLKEGLVAYYPFNGNANDESGNLLSGKTISGSSLTLANDRFGQPLSALYSDSKQSIVCPTKNLLPKSNSQRTISLWFNISSSNAVQTLFDYGAAQQKQRFGILLNSGALYFSGFNYDLSTSVPFIANKWNHYLVVYDGLNMSFYLNGVLSFTAVNVNYPSPLPLSSLNSVDSGSHRFGIGIQGNEETVGLIDDARIYNRALSDAEVKALYAYESTPPDNSFITNGLVAYYPFNGNANDESGNNVNGVIKGVGSYVKGGVSSGNSLMLDGLSGYVESSLVQIKKYITVSGWVKYNRSTQWPAHGIAAQGLDRETSMDWTVSLSQNPSCRLRPHITVNGSWVVFDCNTVIKPDEWCHVMMVYDGIALKGYVNGVLDGSISAPGDFQTTVSDLRIGAYAPVNGTGSKCYFPGNLSLIRIYNRALSDTEVKALYDYESAPQPLNPRIASATAQIVNGFVVGATITDGGYGYVSNPVITITGGGGTGAKATATQFNGVVTSITITNPGIGYTSAPTITIAPPPFPPRKATSTAQIVNGFVVGTKITDGGFGYDTAPAVMIVGGGGSGATAVATVANGVVTAITITNPGTGYTSVPIVRIASPPFAPKLGIETSKVFVRMSVVLGRKYQLEASTDLNTWTTTGPAFIAQDEELAQEFDVNQVGRYFRINQVP